MGIEIDRIVVTNLFPNVSIIPIVTLVDLIKPKTDPSGMYSVLNNKYNYSWNNTYNPAGKLNGIDYRQYLQLGNQQVKNLVGTIIAPGDTNDQKADKTLKWVTKNITYVSDEEQYHFAEYWAKPTETLKSKAGDCVAGYEEIYTSKGLKSAKDLKVGDLALSYDFDKKVFVYKSVIKKWNKGIRKVVRVLFRNGQHIDVTDEHNFLVRYALKHSKYIKKQLKDIDLTRWWKRKVPICIQIPYQQTKPKFNKELYRVIGHYIAEGWYEKKGKVGSSGYDLIEHILPTLNKLKIPFSSGKNGNGVPTINFLKSDFKEYLKGLKRNSFDITLYEELITLPPKYLEELLYGMWLGDGTKKQYPKKIGKNNKKWTYSTSSKQLAEDIQRIGLHLGRTFHIWKQEDHKGSGSSPIYRINYNSNSHYLLNHDYPDLSEVSIRSIKEVGEFQTYDWEVKDTHNFVFKNGIITHNCEDQAYLIHSMLLAAGVPVDRIRTYGGLVKDGSYGLGGHAWTIYKRESDNQWIDLDSTYYTDNTPVASKETFKSQNKYVDAYWWMNAFGTYDEYGKWGINIYA